MSQTDDYARVTHDEAHEEASDSRHIRPATYYGEGPFEPPSSDEEDELLEKIVPGSPGLAERAGVGLEEDGGLVVGGPKHKVRWERLKRCAQYSCLSAAHVPSAMSPHFVGRVGAPGRMYWSVSCHVVHGHGIPCARSKAYHNGPCLQRNVQCPKAELELGTGRFVQPTISISHSAVNVKLSW